MSDDLVLVIGGTRSTGLHAAHALRRAGVGVRVLARNPAAALERVGPHAEIVRGDVTRKDTLVPAFSGVSHVIFTAGVRSGRFARQSVVKATEYEGVLNTIMRAIRVRQAESALTLHECIARADVAEALVAAVYHPDASRVTFEVKWDRGPRQQSSWSELLNGLKHD